MSRKLIAALATAFGLTGTAFAQQAPAQPAPAPVAQPVAEQKPTSDAPAVPAPKLEPLPGNLPATQMSLETLEVLHRKGTLSDAEYQAALKDLAELGERAKTENTLVIGKFATTMYGYVEADLINDSTRSFLDLPGMNAIARPGTPAGELGRTIFSVRNSRIGFRIAAPEVGSIRSSGLLEMDFYGNQPGSPPKSSGFAEGPFFGNPGFRVRHMLLRVEDPVVNLSMGQTWALVGMQGGFQPASMLNQGLPGELYSRTVQLRLDKSVKAGPVTVQVAAAALRPPQMDSQVPDGQAGIKLSFDALKGAQSVGQTGFAISPAAVALSGGMRHFRMANAPGAADAQAGVDGHILAADVLIPVIPAKTRKPWALTVLGEAATSTGYADQYTSLSGGAGVGAPLGMAAADYAKEANVDGMIGWSNKTHQLTGVDWQTLLVSGQLYLPPGGNLWLSATYSNSYSDNVGEFGSSKSVFGHEIFWDAMLVADLTSSTRFGLEYDNYKQNYGDNVQASDRRVMFTGLFIF